MKIILIYLCMSSVLFSANNDSFISDVMSNYNAGDITIDTTGLNGDYSYEKLNQRMYSKQNLYFRTDIDLVDVTHSSSISHTYSTSMLIDTILNDDWETYFDSLKTEVSDFIFLLEYSRTLTGVFTFEFIFNNSINLDSTSSFFRDISSEQSAVLNFNDLMQTLYMPND